MNNRYIETFGLAIEPANQKIWARMFQHIEASRIISSEDLAWTMLSTLAAWQKSILVRSLSKLWDGRSIVSSFNNSPFVEENTELRFNEAYLGRFCISLPQVSSEEAQDKSLLPSSFPVIADQILIDCTTILNSPDTLLLFELQHLTRSVTRLNLELVSAYYSEYINNQIASNSNPPSAMYDFIQEHFCQSLELVQSHTECPINHYQSWLLKQDLYGQMQNELAKITKLLVQNNMPLTCFDQYETILREELAEEARLLCNVLGYSVLTIGIHGYSPVELLNIGRATFSRDTQSAQISKTLRGCVGASESPILLQQYYQSLLASDFAKEFCNKVKKGRKFVSRVYPTGKSPHENDFDWTTKLQSIPYNFVGGAGNANQLLSQSQLHPFQVLAKYRESETETKRVLFDELTGLLEPRETTSIVNSIRIAVGFSKEVAEIIVANTLFFLIGEALTRLGREA